MTKIIGVSVLNAIVVITSFIIFANVAHLFTGQYIDRINLSSIGVVTACTAILLGCIAIESKLLKTQNFAVFGTTILLILIISGAMAVAVAVIGGAIG